MAKDSQPDSKEVREQKSKINHTIAESALNDQNRNNKKQSCNNKHRDKLIDQVKNEYANITSSKSQQHFYQTTTEITPEAYYENLLNAVIKEISKGTFDNSRSGAEIVNSVAANKTLLSEWKSLGG